jgi:iron complex transport system substrate-binding protein
MWGRKDDEEERAVRERTFRWMAPAVLVAVLVLVVLVAACGGGGATATSAAGGSVTTAAVPGTTASTADTRPLVDFTDAAGRTMKIPSPIRKVFCTSPIGTNLMFTLAPDMLIGWNIRPTALEREYIPEKYRTATGLGGWFGKNTTGNVEEIIKRHPDVLLSIGAIDESTISDADRVQGLLHMPAILASGTLETSGDTYRYLGKLLGVEARAEELAAYADDVVGEAKEVAGGVPVADRPTVYYAEGSKGLNSDPEGSEHTEVLTLLGATNVAEVDMPADHGDAVPVSLEQVLVWNPEVILVASDPTLESDVYGLITTGSNWATVTAVKTKQVYQIPRGPFDWFDRPPSVARLLGARWLGTLLYPDLYTYDMRAEAKKFYKLFYQWDLTDAQFDSLTKNALRVE